MKVPEKRKFLNKRDIIIVLVILLVSGSGFFMASRIEEEYPINIYDENAESLNGIQSNRLYAMIYFHGIGVQYAFLNEDDEFSFLLNPEVVFEVKDGAIAFIRSDCPDQLCVSMGWQGRHGGFAACLPNQVLFFVERESEPEARAE